MPIDRRIDARRAASRGFTLAEVLIATSLAAMLSIIVLASLQTSFRFWGRAGADADEIERLTFVHGFLRRMIEGAYPRLSPDGSGFVDFAGDRNTLEFVGPSVSAFAIPGRSRIALTVVTAETTTSLLATLSGDAAGEGASVSETLLEGALEIRFSYRDPVTGEWSDTWRDKAGLPALVRIEVLFDPPARRDWPPLIVRPSIDADVDCRFDPLTGGCRGRPL